MRTATLVLCVVAYAAGVQVGYAPPATSFIYRSDNAGPPSLIQLTPAYAAPLQLAPVPLPYVNAKPIVIEDAEEDEENGYYDDSEDDDESGNDGHLEHGHESGGGSSYGEEHHNSHGEKGSKGYATKGHHAKGVAGDYGKAHNEGYYHEGKGEKGAHHDEADSYGAHHQAGKNYKGGDHGHKKHFSKGEDITGYHKVFHKDEYKKDHDFYDEAAKNGHFQKHGYHKAHHGAEKGAHAKGGHNAAGFEKEGYGKAGYHTNGHVDEADEGHSAEEGADSHYNHHEDYGKKGASDEGREYAYADGDDEE